MSAATDVSPLPRSAPPALPLVAVSARRARRSRRHITFWLVVGAGAAAAIALSLDFSSVARTLSAAAETALSATPGWLIAAGALAIASMVSFGMMRQRTIRAAGGLVSVRESVAVSYAAGAIHVTTPGGVVASTTYAFRSLRRPGVPAAAVTWSLAVTGVLCTLTVILLGAGGLVAGTGAGSWAEFVPGALASSAVGALVISAVRRPSGIERGMAALLRGVNRLVRRPREAGVVTLRTTLADLRAIRPDRRDLVVGTVLAAANWAFDLMCLWACAQALGVVIAPWTLLAGYAIAMLVGSASPLPGGVGVIDTILAVTLVAAAAVPASLAIAVVLLYRVISTGSLMVIGWSIVGVRTVHGAADRAGSARVAAPNPTV